MLRRSRDGRARQYTWSGTPREEEEEEEDAAAVLAAEREEWSRESTQISDSDSEGDFLDISPSAVAVAGALPEAVPVTGESYCHCHAQEELGGGELLEAGRPLHHCLCGEEDQGFDWVWDEACKSAEAFLSCEDRKVSFHSDYSCGTAAARGTRELADGQHFWEIKMTSPVYGTDMMVGIGTSEVNLEKNRHSFCSMLGADEDSWGLSYTGLLQHKGDKVSFSSRFGQGSIIGLHLDTWHGTLTFYKNRRLIGVAATKLQNRKFYPMVCSTAAKSSMKVIRSCYSPTSLQYLCCSRLRPLLPAGPHALAALALPPGLRHHLHARLGWVFSLDDQATPRPGPKQPGDSPADPSPRPGRPDGLAARFLPRPGPDPAPCQCPCLPGARSVPDGCSSEPEDYQSKRCRWT